MPGAQAEGSELSTQMSQLRSEMADSHRSATCERERLMTSLAQQQDAQNALRAEKDEVVSKLHATENEVHSLKLEVHTAGAAASI
eukprot:scaffold23698_cov44-Prasinocladus_malaysianus.AAC.5